MIRVIRVLEYRFTSREAYEMARQNWTSEVNVNTHASINKQSTMNTVSVYDQDVPEQDVESNPIK